MGPGFDELADVADAAERWLFHALRADTDRLRTADDEAWRGLCEAALRTFSAPLVHATLTRHGLIDAAPEEVVVRLARARAFSAGRWRIAVRQVAALGERLSAADVPCMLLKGAHTGRLHAPGARAIGDIDLLVRDRDVHAARQALLEMGYAAQPPSRWLAAHPDHRHLPPFKIVGGLTVELHRTLAEEGEAVPWSDDVWRRAEPLEGGGGALAMEPLDALLYACKHLAVHHLFETTNGFAGLADVAALVQAHRPSPQEVADRAEAWGIRAPVALCLRLARDLLAAEVPLELLDAVRASEVDDAVPSAVWALLHVGGPGMTRHLQLPTRATLNPPPPIAALRGGEPLRATWTFARSSAFPSLDDARLEHPRVAASRFPHAAYPLLWSRLAWRHAGLVRLLDPRARAEARRRKRTHQQRLSRAIGQGG